MNFISFLYASLIKKYVDDFYIHCTTLLMFFVVTSLVTTRPSLCLHHISFFLSISIVFILHLLVMPPGNPIQTHRDQAIVFHRIEEESQWLAYPNSETAN